MLFTRINCVLGGLCAWQYYMYKYRLYGRMTVSVCAHCLSLRFQLLLSIARSLLFLLLPSSPLHFMMSSVEWCKGTVADTANSYWLLLPLQLCASLQTFLVVLEIRLTHALTNIRSHLCQSVVRTFYDSS